MPLETLPVEQNTKAQPDTKSEMEQLSSQELSTQDTQEDSTMADPNANDQRSISQRQSISSQSSMSSMASVSSTTISSSHLNEPDEPSYVKDLIKRATHYTNTTEALDSEQLKLLVGELTTSLSKARAEAGQYKIKAELLSISSKDADMRYEVENDLIKRQVERLKAQGENMDILMKKLSHQKLTLKKYKNEIINKNKEIIRLRSNSNNSSIKKRKKSNQEVPGMLDTLGLLASQVLTEEQKQSKQTNHELYPNQQQFAMPKLNSFKHRSTPDRTDNVHNDTTISEYSMNQSTPLN